ncbi:GNAT family N-acetyltransferase [Anaerosporobacter faecicola]|uniref:GNAT family N-acetyltransferase n=1 Tax=Anaerosporobacter faecicola TaxID=2718714 RepID=UPI00143A860E|nr:GNAT family N-acetyltransferase [Anaerosporobacter faecicola]
MKYLRDVILTDMDLLFQWVNETEVRKNSFNIEMIKYENHIRWFHDRYQDNNCFMYILMDNDTPVGQIRLEYKDNIAYIDYSIQKNYRKKGYGTVIIKLIENKVREIYDRTILVANVKKSNIHSIMRFRNLGYSCIEYNDYFEFSKEIDNTM